MKHTFGSLFAGVGGFDLGMEAAGWTCAWQVEWDKQCQQVLKHHWPDIAKYGDVSDVNGTTITPVDCITFGSPCQDLSVAGKRAGLDGNRSGLFFEAVRIIKEMRDATGSVYPRWAIWENVVGALSSNHGHDFAAVLDSLAEAGALAIEWAVLDAQHFGVPQRRRRVFVIACFDPATADRCGDPLLPVAESLRRDTPAKRTARSTAAGRTAGCADAGCSLTGETTHTHTVSALTATGVGTCGADDNQAQAGHLVPCGNAQLGREPGWL
jgi:DNA (cytosine-5)-methyltransferase 1